jgi:hypothetical protein
MRLRQGSSVASEPRILGELQAIIVAAVATVNTDMATRIREKLSFIYFCLFLCSFAYLFVTHVATL